MKTFAFVTLCTLALCASNGVFAARSLQQLPVLAAGPPVAAAPAPAPGLGNAACALAFLESAGDFTTLIDLVAASSEASLLTELLNSDTEMATLFAPTDAGIQATLTKAGLTSEQLLADPELLTSVLQYHITPSQLSPADLQNGFSFNTLLETNNVPQSIAVSGNGVTSTIQGGESSGQIMGYDSVCQFKVYPIDGLLMAKS